MLYREKYIFADYLRNDYRLSQWAEIVKKSAFFFIILLYVSFIGIWIAYIYEHDEQYI